MNVRFCICVACIAISSLAQKPEDSPFLRDDGTFDVDAAVDHFDKLYRSETSHARVTLKIVRPRQERTLDMETWSAGEEKALVVIEAPPREAGTATLKVGDNLWNYLPRIKRTIRIPPSMMLASWMGSDFTNDDLVHEASYDTDYSYDFMGPAADLAVYTEAGHEEEGWWIRFTIKEDVVGLWEQFDLVVSPDATIPIWSAWYNRKGELARVMSWDQVQVMDGKRIPARMTLVPTDKEEDGHKTIMIYHEIDFNVELPADIFSLSRLERQR